MSPVTEITSQNEFDERAHIKSNWRTRITRSLISVLVIISVVVAWQLLNAYNNSTDPTVAGRPFTVKAGSGKAAGQFYAFYFYAGWLETRDMGSHWYSITRGTLSNMQTPSLLTDPSDPNHLFLGGAQGLYESHRTSSNDCAPYKIEGLLVMKIVKLYWRIAFVLLAFLLLAFLFPDTQQSYADGGAPNLAYIAGTAKGISIIDIGQQRVSGSFTIDGDPAAIYLSLDGRFLYVTQPTSGHVSMIAAKTGQTICSAKVSGQPSLLAFDPGLNVLYTAGNDGNNVTVLDPNNCAIKQIINMNSPIYGLAVAIIGSGAPGETTNQLWVADATSLNIFQNKKQLARVQIPGDPQYISTPPGFTAYVTTRQGNVYAVDLTTRKLSRPLISGGAFGPMDYNAFTSEVYIPDMQNKQVDVLSPIFPGANRLPREPNYSIHLGVVPRSIAITSDGQLGFIALQGGNVAMLDIPGKQIVNTILVGGNPHFIITGLYPPLIGTTPQEASVWGTVINIAAYVLVIALLVVPIILFQRYARTKDANQGKR